MSKEKPKRKIYDSVFVSLFSRPKYRLQLYRDLHPDDLDVTEEDIKDVTIEAVMMEQMYNDLGFLVHGRSIVLLEAQSSWCANMSVRALMYLAETYKTYIERTEQYVYGRKPISLPKPELYILYTGNDHKDKQVLTMSDTYWDGDDSFLDVKVKVLHGSGDGILAQYAKFIDIYQDKFSKYGKTKKTVLETIRECIELDVLKEYLQEQKGEVMDIMMALYDRNRIQEMYGRSKHEEGREEGRAEGRKENAEEVYIRMKKRGFSDEDARAVAYGENGD